METPKPVMQMRGSNVVILDLIICGLPVSMLRNWSWSTEAAAVEECQSVALAAQHSSLHWGDLVGPALSLAQRPSFLRWVQTGSPMLVSHCFWKCVRFCFCCCLFVFVVCTCILCLLPCLAGCSFTDVLSCTPTGVSEINELNYECWSCGAYCPRMSGWHIRDKVLRVLLLTAFI